MLREISDLPTAWGKDTESAKTLRHCEKQRRRRARKQRTRDRPKRQKAARNPEGAHNPITPQGGERKPKAPESGEHLHRRGPRLR